MVANHTVEARFAFRWISGLVNPRLSMPGNTVPALKGVKMHWSSRLSYLFPFLIRTRDSPSRVTQLPFAYLAKAIQEMQMIITQDQRGESPNVAIKSVPPRHDLSVDARVFEQMQEVFPAARLVKFKAIHFLRLSPLLQVSLQVS
jgi:hypothetical protein